MYRSGQTDVDYLAGIYGVSSQTIYRWAKEGNWKTDIAELVDIEKDIQKNMLEALNAGLKQYKDDPGNKSLQSLVVLIKDYLKKSQPTKELNTYILLFLEQTVDYFISKNNEDLKIAFQENVVELAEFLRMKNNG